jgi:hypothetical protein
LWMNTPDSDYLLIKFQPNLGLQNLPSMFWNQDVQI